MNKSAQTALEQFVSDKNLEELEKILEKFNIFKILNINEEKYHSNLLAFLLNPSESHKLGNTFLKQFLKAVLSDVEEPRLSLNEIDSLNLTDVDIY